jgi:hypothetical protein
MGILRFSCITVSCLCRAPRRSASLFDIQKAWL